MSKHSIPFLTVVVTVFGLVSSGSAVTWDHQYEGDVLPDAFVPPFSLQVSGGGSSTTLNAGGWVDITGQGGGWYQWDMNTNWGVGASGSTLELRLAVPLVSSTYGTSIQILDTVVGQWYFTWNASNIYGFGDDQGKPAFDTSAFNTYRFTFLQDGTANVYLNDDPMPRLTVAAHAPVGLTNFSIGELSNEARGTGSYDYVYWTTQGAFPPVPEPGSAALLLAGAALLCVRYVGGNCRRHEAFCI